jgi:hypothetical protein
MGVPYQMSERKLGFKRRLWPERPRLLKPGPKQPIAVALAQKRTMPISALLMPIRRTAWCFLSPLNENFNGDGAVVSYLNNVRRTNETIMKLRQWHCRLRSRTELAVMMSPVAMATTL